MQAQKYPLSMRLMHWIMALLIIFMLALGFYMTNVGREDPGHLKLYELHKSIGAMILILVFFRITIRLLKPVPPLPDTIDTVTQFLAHLGHLALYVLMILMPLSGYLMSNFFGFHVMLFGIPMPTLVSANFEMGNLFAQIHEILGFAFLAVLGIHIAAVIKHRFFDLPENDILKRMM